MTQTVKEIKIETKIDTAGRIMFPAILRKAIDLTFGERVVIELKEGKLLIYKPVPLEQ